MTDAASAIRNILIVDISHLFWTTALGMRAALAATDVVMQDIQALARNYDRVVICPDPKGPSWRQALCPGYKAGRTAERTPERWAALDRLIDYCAHAGWHVLEAPEHPLHSGFFYEADDGIATAVDWLAEKTGAAIDVLSGDSDLAMLTDDERSVRFMRRYGGRITPMDSAAVEEWTKIPPSVILEVKALAGDGDGYKPFEGIAKAGAVTLLNKLPADRPRSARAVVEAALAAGILKNKDGKTDNHVSKILNEGGVARVEFGYSMARLCRDAPIDCASVFQKRESSAHSDITDDLLPDDVDGEPISADYVASNSPGPSATALVASVAPSFIISAADARARIIAIREVIRATMKPGVDYQRYSWAPKPFLHKPGAEKLANFFSLVPDYECVEKIEDWKAGFFFYRYRCILRRKDDGSHAGAKFGSCNSKESKYASRWEYESKVPEHLEIDKLQWREFTARKGPNRGQKVRQWLVPNEDIYSIVHTIDAMAQKRAYVLTVREVTNTGGIFDVDEDLPRGGGEDGRD